jgi:hypothetical protein
VPFNDILFADGGGDHPHGGHLVRHGGG